MPKLIYSQNCYPQKIIINSDTLVLIQPFQLVRANVLMLEGQRDRMIVTNLREQLLTANELLGICNESERLLKLKYETLEQKIMEVELLSEQEKASAIKQKRKEKRKMFFVGGAVGIAIVLAIGLFI